MSTETEQTQAVATSVDLDSIDASLVEETISINPEANPMEEVPPVDDGKYRVKVLVDQKSWEQRETKENKSGNKTTYLSVKASFEIVDGKFEGRRVFGNFLSTLVFDGKCEMAYLLIKMLGDTPEARQEVANLKNYVELAKAFKQVSAGEPIVQVSTKWVAQYVSGKNEKTGKDEYKVARSGQRNFPPDGKGGFKHVFVHPQSGQEVKARAEIQDYFSDK